MTVLLVLLSACLAFYINYGVWVMPYLLLAILVTSLWRIQAGVICLVLAIGVLAVAVASEAKPDWRSGFEEMLRLMLLGMLGLGARGLLNGREQQRQTEVRLIEELSRAVEQLRESEQRQAQAAQALAERSHLLQAILEAVDNGIFLADREGRVRFANARLRELLDLEPSEVVGRDAVDAVLGPVAARSLRLTPQPVEEPAGEVSRLFLELDPPTSRLLCEYNAPVRGETGAVLGDLYVYSDLPDRERLQELLEARVEERTRELREVHEQLLRAERLAALGQFSATMAHELRNPLNVIKLSVHYITSHLKQPDDKMKRHLSHMNEYVERACAIISDLLAFSRLPPPQLEPIRLNEVVQEAIQALSIPEGVTIEWVLDPDMPSMSADGRQIEQAVINLGMNALQAMNDRGCLTIGTRRLEEWVEINVRDTGPGIPQELEEKVMEPFFSTKVTGTGLGLPLVREIALAHGGRCTLQNLPGEGACFSLVLPMQPAPVSPAPSTPPSDPPLAPDPEHHSEPAPRAGV